MIRNCISIISFILFSGSSFLIAAPTNFKSILGNPLLHIVNKSPFAVDDVFYLKMHEESIIDVLSNDYDPEGDRLRIVSLNKSDAKQKKNQKSLNFDGCEAKIVPPGMKIHLQCFTNKKEWRQLSYTISDKRGATSSAKLLIKGPKRNIRRPRPKPKPREIVAIDDLASVKMNQSIVINVLQNDKLIYSRSRITKITNISGGIADLVSNNRKIKVTPAIDSSKPITFRYTVESNGKNATADVKVLVHEPPNVETFIDPKFGIEMIRIPAGTFMIGSPSSEKGHDEWEGPQHQVTISKDFYLGKYEVTQSQWDAVMGSKMSLHSNKRQYYNYSDKHPAFFMTWTDINRVGGFLDKLNRAVGCDISNLPKDYTRYRADNVSSGCYRLPTEAEWEYSARAGTTAPFSHGDADLTNYAWYAGNSKRGRVYPVGQKLPNPWGLYDMHGNVEEWVYDEFDRYNSSSKTDPTGPPGRRTRIIRGGNSFNSSSQLRAASRRDLFPSGNSSNGLGFRLLLVR